MAVSVTLPARGESVTEGTVTRWLKGVGERVVEVGALLGVTGAPAAVPVTAPAPVAEAPQAVSAPVLPVARA